MFMNMCVTGLGVEGSFRYPMPSPATLQMPTPGTHRPCPCECSRPLSHLPQPFLYLLMVEFLLCFTSTEFANILPCFHIDIADVVCTHACVPVPSCLVYRIAVPDSPPVPPRHRPVHPVARTEDWLRRGGGDQAAQPRTAGMRSGARAGGASSWGGLRRGRARASRSTTATCSCWPSGTGRKPVSLRCLSCLCSHK